MDLRQLPALNAIRAFEAAARHEFLARRRRAVRHARRGQPPQTRTRGRTRRAAVHAQRQAAVPDRRRHALRAADPHRADGDRRRDPRRARERPRPAARGVDVSSFAARFITPRIGTFIERHPEIDVELQSTNSLTDFARDDVDIAIRFGQGNYPAHVEPLFDEVFFPACADAERRQAAANARGSRALQPAALGRRAVAAVVRRGRAQDADRAETGILYQDSSNLLLAAIDGQASRWCAARWRCTTCSTAHRAPVRHRRRLVALFFVCPPPLVNTPRVQAFRPTASGSRRIQAFSDELDRGARREDPAECAQEGGWKALEYDLTIGWPVSAR